MKPWFVIRADAGLNIGIGHIMRCMALAEWALDYDLTAVLITRELPKGLQKNIRLLNTEIRLLPNNNECNSLGDYTHSSWLSTSERTDAEQTADIILRELRERRCSPSFIIVDHYALAAPWEIKINKFAPILCIDDLNDRPHHCKWLLDQTFNKSNKSYYGLINASCKLYIGTDYALLRKEFQRHKHADERTFPSLDANWNVLITLGGVDKFNVTALMLSLLSQTKMFHRLNITAVVGSTNPNLTELKLICEKAPERLRLSVDANNMSELMANSDLCIGAAGSTSWERCAMHLPTLMVVIADNQLSIAENLAKGELCFNMGRAETLSLQDIENNLSNIMSQPDVYRTMINNSHSVCDGLGCRRILNTLMRE
ncbi:MAG: UDP-2,4-diacetamido-2,4,6-trideoxy-beta-L-altropyranose hydrolase [Colwellia sp.]|nr:UDP-2,4-diacetamido-2,4,6-trideoxy-beta-L-altropyranose hydrolase [Colwellia sp.]